MEALEVVDQMIWLLVKFAALTVLNMLALLIATMTAHSLLNSIREKKQTDLTKRDTDL